MKKRQAKTATRETPRAFPGSVKFDNTGRTLLISGGGQGIGEAVGRAWVGSGGKVLVMDVNAGLASSVASWGGNFFHGDVTEVADCRTAVGTAVREFGRLDACVPCAVIEGPKSYRRPHEIPERLWHQYLDVNLTGYQNLAAAAVAQLLRQPWKKPTKKSLGTPRGYLCFVNSVQGTRNGRRSGIYGATKAAGIALTRTYGVEYARDGIIVAGVSPGATMTQGMVAKLKGQGGSRSLANRHPNGRLLLPEEIANMVIVLLSPLASGVCGATFDCDGGLNALATFDTPFPVSTMPTQPSAQWQR